MIQKYAYIWGYDLEYCRIVDQNRLGGITLVHVILTQL